jgi:hypothetical protein
MAMTAAMIFRKAKPVETDAAFNNLIITILAG